MKDGDEQKVLFSEIQDDCIKVFNKHVNSFLKDMVFNLKDIDFMINHLNELILPDLKHVSSNFKFILCFAFLQNDSSGFTQDMALYYNKETDGCITTTYKFQNLICVVNLFCLSI